MAAKGGGVYFPVHAGFCDTTVARQITRRLGDAGFHAYVRLLCLLLNEEGGRLPLQLPEEWEDLADRLVLDEESTRELVALMEHYHALEMSDGYAYSPTVSEALAIYSETKEARRRGAEKANAARRKKKEDAERNAERNAESTQLINQSTN